jgi:hypothetical protein
MLELPMAALDFGCQRSMIILQISSAFLCYRSGQAEFKDKVEKLRR